VGSCNILNKLWSIFIKIIKIYNKFILISLYNKIDILDKYFIFQY